VFNKLCKTLGITIERNCLIEKKINWKIFFIGFIKYSYQIIILKK
jgi:hypothetical protein